MTDVELTHVKVKRAMSPQEADAYVGQMVPELEPKMPHAGPVLLHDDDGPVMIYRPLPHIAELRQAILRTDMQTTYRSSGITNLSRTFGMAPRKPIQWREGCAPTSLARDEPDIMNVLTWYAGVLRDILHTTLPDIEAMGQHALAPVLPEWRLTDDSLWTSGVINKSSQLPYHRDRFNFDAWSAMPVLRRGARGGYLAVPEYDMVVPCRDGWGLFWSGYRLVHGVTPIHAKEKDAYRFTVVYYALKGMKDCHTAAKELEYAQKKRTEREQASERPPQAHQDDDGNPYGDF
jgi:hypothetical protein